MENHGQVHELVDIIQDLFNVLLFQKTQIPHFWQTFFEAIRVATRCLRYGKCQCEWERIDIMLFKEFNNIVKKDENVAAVFLFVSNTTAKLEIET